MFDIRAFMHETPWMNIGGLHCPKPLCICVTTWHTKSTAIFLASLHYKWCRFSTYVYTAALCVKPDYFLTRFVVVYEKFRMNDLQVELSSECAQNDHKMFQYIPKWSGINKVFTLHCTYINCVLFFIINSPRIIVFCLKAARQSQ